MGWRDNMGAAKRKNNVSNPIDSIDVIDKTPSKIVNPHSSVNFVSSVNGVQKVKTPKIIIKKMSTCLHGKTCAFITLVDDRQICSKNNQPIFDMASCPVGKWERFKNKPQEKTMTCYSCGGQTFWRKKDNQRGRWICSECHPPVKPEDEVEYSQ